MPFDLSEFSLPICFFSLGIAVSEAVWGFFTILLHKGNVVSGDLGVFFQKVDLVFGVSGDPKLVFGVSDGGGRLYTDFFFKFLFHKGKCVVSWT